MCERELGIYNDSSLSLNVQIREEKTKKLYSTECGVYIIIWYLLHVFVLLGNFKDAAFVVTGQSTGLDAFWDVASAEIWNYRAASGKQQPHLGLGHVLRSQACT